MQAPTTPQIEGHERVIEKALDKETVKQKGNNVEHGQGSRYFACRKAFQRSERKAGKHENSASDG